MTASAVRPFFVAVSGLPGSGKTTLGRALAIELGMGFVCRDHMKEALHSVFPATDRESSNLLGAAAYEVLWALLPSLTEGVLEAYWPISEPWRSRARRVLSNLSSPTIEVFCDCPKELSIERFIARSATDRHPAHAEHFGEYPLTRMGLGELWPDPEPLGLDTVIRVDTSAEVDVAAFATRVRAAAAG
jgi:predicted kinase